MKYSFFDSVKSRLCRQLSVAELTEVLRSEYVKNTCAALISALELGDDTEAQRLKSKLPVVVLSELYDVGCPRKAGSGRATGLFMLDYDDCADKDALDALTSRVMELATGHEVLKNLIVAAHWSPRRHGVHVWCRWIEGCGSVEECQRRFAELSGLSDYDVSCKDASRCSYLVDIDWFFVQNWGAMERNEDWAKLQEKLCNSKKVCNKKSKKNGSNSGTNDKGGNECPDLFGGAGCAGAGSGDDEPAVEGLKEGRKWAEEYEGVKYKDIVRELTIRCAPASKVDESGNVKEGARDNTLFKVCCLLRYVCDNNVEWVESLVPEWGRDLDEDNEGRVRQLVESACKRGLSFSLPRTLRVVLDDLKKAGHAAENAKEEEERLEIEAADYDGRVESFLTVPDCLPPVFAEFTKAMPRAWKPATILALLPMLGTIMSRVRGVYLDGRVHSPSFQTVIEAKFGRGKGNISDLSRFILEPLTEADAIGNAELNAYNAEVERNNGTEKLREKPDVCVRKITGDFTVAGFEETLGTSKGLHMWCGTSEIDEVRKVWAAVSHILRKAYDNDMYGRSLQSTKTYRGERRVFFNTLLCGTSRAVRRCYPDPEDGLVSRTLFFKLMVDDEKMPVMSMNNATKCRLEALVKRLHDRYSLGNDGQPVDECMINLIFLNKALSRWLEKKYKESLLRGMPCIDSFRRRDAVNGFRAGMLATAIYMVVGRVGVLNAAERKTVTDFALWVAEYGLRMHVLKYGKELDRMEDEAECELDVVQGQDVLQSLPKTFSLRDAYKTFAGRSMGSVRSLLARLVAARMLVREERGMYSKR